MTASNDPDSWTGPSYDPLKFYCAYRDKKGFDKQFNVHLTPNQRALVHAMARVPGLIDAYRGNAQNVVRDAIAHLYNLRKSQGFDMSRSEGAYNTSMEEAFLDDSVREMEERSRMAEKYIQDLNMASDEKDIPRLLLRIPRAIQFSASLPSNHPARSTLSRAIDKASEATQ